MIEEALVIRLIGFLFWLFFLSLGEYIGWLNSQEPYELTDKKEKKKKLDNPIKRSSSSRYIDQSSRPLS